MDPTLDGFSHHTARLADEFSDMVTGCFIANCAHWLAEERPDQTAEAVFVDFHRDLTRVFHRELTRPDDGRLVRKRSSFLPSPLWVWVFSPSCS